MARSEVLISIPVNTGMESKEEAELFLHKSDHIEVLVNGERKLNVTLCKAAGHVFVTYCPEGGEMPKEEEDVDEKES